MVHMMIGIPGSGKSTYAEELAKILNCEIVSTDRVRMNNTSWEESQIWPEVYRLCAMSLSNNEDIIFDATNITPKVRKRFVDEVSKYEVKIVMGAYYFDTPWEECKRRVEIRNEDINEHHIPIEIIQSYAEKIIYPTIDEGFLFIKKIVQGLVVEEKDV